MPWNVFAGWRPCLGRRSPSSNLPRTVCRRLPLKPSNKMKSAMQILAVFGLAIAMFAVDGRAAQSPANAGEDPAHQELRQLRDGLLAAMNKGDIDTALTYLHTNVVITWHNAEVSRGHEGVRAYNSRVMTGPNKIV